MPRRRSRDVVGRSYMDRTDHSTRPAAPECGCRELGAEARTGLRCESSIEKNKEGRPGSRQRCRPPGAEHLRISITFASDACRIWQDSPLGSSSSSRAAQLIVGRCSGSGPPQHSKTLNEENLSKVLFRREIRGRTLALPSANLSVFNRTVGRVTLCYGSVKSDALNLEPRAESRATGTGFVIPGPLPDLGIRSSPCPRPRLS